MIDIKRQCGVVFISVLIFLAILSESALLFLRRSELAVQMQHNFQMRSENFQVAQRVLQISYERLRNNHASCQVPLMSSAVWLKQDEHFWRSRSLCHGKMGHYRYQYGFSLLEKNYCARLNHHRGVAFWQMTVRSVLQHHDDMLGPVTLLQQVVAVPINPVKSCLNPSLKRQLRQVRQSWRWL